MVADPIAVALRVARALEACGTQYLVGGSLASAISGEPRSTLDVDLVVGLAESDIDRFVNSLADEFYADPERYLQAYTAEDILLPKLRWYRVGDEVSDRGSVSLDSAPRYLLSDPHEPVRGQIGE